MSVIDQFNDPAFGHLVKSFTAMPSLEGFVKTASMERDEIDALPADAFAWPEARRFPVHNAEHAALSYAYSKLAGDTLPPEVSTKLSMALDIYEIPRRIFETVKVAHEERPEDWLCSDLKLFSVKTASEVSVAQHQFLDNYEKLDVPHRKMAAENLVKKAAEYKLPVRLHVMKTAGMTVSNLRTVRKWVEAREDASVKSEHKQAFAKIASSLRQYGEESADTEALSKLASAIAELDKRADLEKHYDRRLPDPMLTIFNTDKLASESIDIDGMMVSSKKVASLPASFWEDLGGSELADEIAPGGRVDLSKLATVVSTLPMDLKRVIKAQLR